MKFYMYIIMVTVAGALCYSTCVVTDNHAMHALVHMRRTVCMLIRIIYCNPTCVTLYPFVLIIITPLLHLVMRMATLGKISKFQLAVEEWIQYIKCVEFFVANGITLGDKKRAIFLTLNGLDTYTLLRNMLHSSRSYI